MELAPVTLGQAIEAFEAFRTGPGGPAPRFAAPLRLVWVPPGWQPPYGPTRWGRW